MKYAKLENGKWKMIPRPNWYEDLEDEPGAPVTDATLINNGIYPIEFVSPEYDSNLQRLSLTPEEEWEVIDDQLIIQYVVTNKDPVEIIGEVASQRYQVESSGLSWTDEVSGRIFMLDTSVESQNRFASARLAVQAGVRVDGSIWKCAEVTPEGVVIAYRNTSNAEIETWAALVHHHVQKCFEVESITVTKLLSGISTDFSQEFINYQPTGE